jgi:hypothetical protein
MKKTFFDRHAEAIKSGLYEEGMINGFRKAAHAVDRRAHGYSVGQSSARVTTQECDALMRLVSIEQPRVSRKQCEKGRDYLQKHRRKLGDRERAILDNLSHFTLIDYHDAGECGLAFYVPIYRAYSKDGSSFAYYATAWQSGGGFEIVD